MQIYIKIMDRLDKLLEILAICATLGMTLFMILTVLNRFVLGGVLTGCEEWSRICFCWTLFFVVGCCSKVGNFASIGLLRQYLPQKGKIVHYIICQLVGIAIAAVFIPQGILFCLKNLGSYYGTLRISAVAFMYSSVPAGFIFLALNCVNNIFRAIVMARGGEVVGELSDEEDLSLDINVEEVEMFRQQAESDRKETDDK